MIVSKKMFVICFLNSNITNTTNKELTKYGIKAFVMSVMFENTKTRKSVLYRGFEHLFVMFENNTKNNQIVC